MPCSSSEDLTAQHKSDLWAIADAETAQVRPDFFKHNGGGVVGSAGHESWHVTKDGNCRNENEPILLVIDGSRLSADPFLLGIGAEGFRVVLVDQGEEGLRLSTSLGASAILLGSHLPDLSGHALLRLLQGRRVPPVIGLSGTDDEDSDSRLGASNSGAVDFLNRPSRGEGECSAYLGRDSGHVEFRVRWGAMRSRILTAR